MTLWIVMAAIELLGTLFMLTYGWLVLRRSERPVGAKDWILWVLYALLWLPTAAHGVFEFFYEDYEE